ncbi:MAG: tRNA pseudouridine(55) synthase TruB [Alphaproteobacteria bacterium]|nr:tRNA pseudouridine(55) synthase TruB [Alphaproteobacteria bacterium]
MTSDMCKSGWIILDKPYGMTSSQATNVVRRLFGAAKAGHTGTLDPLATGILLIALNEATKAIPYIVSDVKQYRFQVTWGEQRTTDDAEGAVIATSSNRPTEKDIQSILHHFIGTIQQRPPLFSALKIKGKRAYDLARSGDEMTLKCLNEAITLKTRPVTIENLILESIDSNEQATFMVTCGSGTYVRSLARDMADLLHTKGYVSSLRRVSIGKFHQKDAISLEKLRELGHKSKLQHSFLPVKAVLDDIPAVPITMEEASMICQGQRISCTKDISCKSLVVLTLMRQIVAIAEECNGYFYPKRVFK